MDADEAGQGPGSEDFCYLTTTGRVTGRPHRIEIWFGLDDATVYLLAGGGHSSDWVRNLSRNPSVIVELGGRALRARARVVEDDDEQVRARRLLFEKYRPRYGGSLERWRETALPVAVDLPHHP